MCATLLYMKILVMYILYLVTYMQYYVVYLIFCYMYVQYLVFVLSFSSHSRTFHSFGEVTIAGEGLQILTFARLFWPLSSEGSSACHTYCDTGHPFIMVISEDPWHSHVMPRVCQWSYHYLFYRIWSVAAGIRTLNLPLAGERYKSLRHRRGFNNQYFQYFITYVQYILNYIRKSFDVYSKM